MNFPIINRYVQYSFAGVAALIVTALAINFLVIQGWSFASPGHEGGHGEESTIQGSDSAYPLVTVTQPTNAETHTQNIEAAGTVLAKLQADVHPRREGLVRQMHVDLGDTVYKGQLLATLEPDQSQSELTAELKQLQKELEIAKKRANLSTDQHLQAAQSTKNAYDKEYEASLSQVDAEITSIQKQLEAEKKKIEAEIQAARLQKEQSEKSISNIAFDLLDAAVELLYEDGATIKTIATGNIHNRRHEVYSGNQLVADQVEADLLKLYRMLQGETEFPETNELIVFLSTLSKNVRLLPATASTNGTSFTEAELDHAREKIDEVTDHYFEVSKELASSDASVISLEAERERLETEAQQQVAKLTQGKEVLSAGNQQKQAGVQRDIVDLQADRTSAQLDAEKIEAQIQKVRSQIGAASTVYAPFSGVITKRHVNIGDSVSLEKPLFSLVDSSQKFVRFYVTESDIPFLQKGTDVTFSPTSAPSQKFTATISRISQAIDPVNRTIQIEADIQADQDDARILTEMTTRVSIPVTIDEGLVAVPESALEISGEQDAVFVVNADAEIEKKPVSVSYVYGGFAYLSSEEVSTEWIVIKSPVLLEEGMPVDTTL